MKEAVIKTSFGEIRFTYDSHTELMAALERIVDEVKAIKETVKAIVPQPISLTPASTTSDKGES